ncbi:MAG TPA: ATP-binding protein [Burkholderiaceae bacterium]|nr:ATP-binding protein [Burkholderiaceae bacterium]
MSNETASIRLLVVEDSELDYELLLAILGRDQALTGFKVRAERVEDEPGMQAAFARGRVDAVVTDHNLPRFDSFQALAIAKRVDEDLPVIVLSGEMSEELAVAALHAGADDFILKARMFRLAPALRRSLQAAAARRAARDQTHKLAASEARLRELTQHLEYVKENERRAIAREIHDDIGTTLTALKFELTRLARELASRPSAAPRINAMQELLAHAAAASHRIQHNLRPPVLDAGLVAALEWLVRGFSERTGVTSVFESNRDELELPPERAAALYRVAQESLANVAKHAQATRVSVQVFETEDEVSLEVTDNGVGFDSRLLASTPGFGLRGLVERARGFGGWAEVNSANGRGTTVMFAIPRATAGAADAEPSTAGRSSALAPLPEGEGKMSESTAPDGAAL